MGCCKCEEFKWPDPQDVVWVNGDKEYCVFHAPAGEKWKDLGGDEQYTDNEYNEHIYARIEAAKQAIADGNAQAECDLSGVIIPGDISFSHYSKTYPLPATSFHSATFSGKALFARATLSEATFSGEALFTKATFSGEAWFDGVTFGGAAVFEETTFGGKASFRKATFGGEALFVKATFCSEARFSGAKFGSKAWFNWSTFRGTAEFSRATFSGRAEFSGATFNGWVGFSGTKFSGEAEFEGAHFGAYTYFYRLLSKNKSIRLHSLASTTLEHLQFSPLDLPAFSFLGCEWPDRLGPETHGDGSAENLKECEELYRAMKQRAASEHDQPQVSRWHFREKLMFKKQRFYRRWLPVTITWWYWATSGFGERAAHAGFVLALLIGLAWLLNFIPTPESVNWEYGWGAYTANATMASIPFAKDVPGEGWVKVGRGVMQFLLALQFTLFALAVRNRFRR